ncbi:hypothetical protein [Streptomyces sp. NBC_01794]|uniref:hypothetical protein n=1 Tax=Streptomyces sp. NBC_01794 TaxID=2975942 RepID=UPI00309023F5|nr:hypothetical protein OIE54_11910 [Streptomyces sp. NBC_01794]
MHARPIAAAAVSAILLATLAAGCSSSGDAEPGKTTASSTAAAGPAATPAAVLGKLDPVWTPKLDAAAGPNAEATGSCRIPSSIACADAIDRIMTVVSDIEAAIGDRPYRTSLEQIGKMRAADTAYVAAACKGNPAGDSTGACTGAWTITVGAATLGMALLTDDYRTS